MPVFSFNLLMDWHSLSRINSRLSQYQNISSNEFNLSNRQLIEILVSFCSKNALPDVHYLFRIRDEGVCSTRPELICNTVSGRWKMFTKEMNEEPRNNFGRYFFKYNREIGQTCFEIGWMKPKNGDVDENSSGINFEV